MQSPDMVLTCRRVLDGAEVCFVSHEWDGDWQYLCGGDHRGGDDGPKRIHLAHLETSDVSLASMRELARGSVATRDARGGRWTERNEAAEAHPDDCACCAVRDAPLDPDGFDAAERKCVDDVRRYGLHILNVTDEPEFSYSVGLYASYRHPEIVVFGLGARTAAAIVNGIGKAARSGASYRAGALYDDILESYACRFIDVRSDRSYREYLGWNLWYYARVRRLGSGKPPVLQLLTPDRDGRFPGDAGYAGVRQPMLD